MHDRLFLSIAILRWFGSICSIPSDFSVYDRANVCRTITNDTLADMLFSKYRSCVTRLTIKDRPFTSRVRSINFVFECFQRAALSTGFNSPCSRFNVFSCRPISRLFLSAFRIAIPVKSAWNIKIPPLGKSANKRSAKRIKTSTIPCPQLWNAMQSSRDEISIQSRRS